MIDFAELKLKLTEFDEDCIYKFSQQENNGTWSWQMILEGANYQHTKDAKIISQLLDAIEMQNEALKFYKDPKNWTTLDILGNGEIIKQDGLTRGMMVEQTKLHMVTGGQRAYNCLSETESKLKQLIKGE